MTTTRSLENNYGIEFTRPSEMPKDEAEQTIYYEIDNDQLIYDKELSEKEEKSYEQK